MRNSRKYKIILRFGLQSIKIEGIGYWYLEVIKKGNN